MEKSTGASLAFYCAKALVACRRAATALVALPFMLAACGGSDEPPAGGNAAPTLTSIVVSSASTDLGVGASLNLTAEARDQHGAVMPGVAFSWSSSDSGVAVAIGGVTTGVSAGSAAITASSGGVTSNPVNLRVVVVAASSVAIDKPFVFLTGAGQSSPLAAQIFDPNGAPASGAVTWTSSAPDKVSVDASGRVQALGIGSAQIVASGGGARSAPTLVVVAEPKPGALLVGDAQVASIGQPSAAGDYEVVLQGVAAPAPGSVVLGAETAPIAGKVVATRPDAAGVVVTLAVAPLYELFAAYDIKLAIDLSAFPAEALPASAGARVGIQRWNVERHARSRPLAARPLDNVLAPFRAFNCDASVKPQLLGEPVQLSLENSLVLTLEDRPGYSKHALEGSAAIVGKAGLKLKVGFTASGRCDAQAQIKLPVLGWVSLLVMPAVRFGLGVEVSGKVLVAQGELGVDGRVSVDPVLGWECGGATPECRGLNKFLPVTDKFKTKSELPDSHGMEADISAHFYVVAGLDASILLGLANAEIVEARGGPRQHFNVAFEDDQAARADYAGSYDLTWYGVIEPGAALQKAIKQVIDDGGVSVKLEAEFTKRVSESPKGTHTVSKSRVRPGDPVDFTVAFDDTTVAYWELGYNIDRVDLYRKAEGEAAFVYWKSMTLIASNRATYRWTPDTSEAGKYQFAAFVNTVLPVPLLEVSVNSVQEVEVSCFSAPMVAGRARALSATANAARSKPLATTCADVWNGESTVVLGSPEENITARASITWTYDPSTSGDDFLGYKPKGSFTLTGAHAGCTVSFSPSSFAITDTTVAFLQIMAAEYVFTGEQAIHTTQTVSCPGKDDIVNHLNGFSIMYAYGGGPFAPDQVVLSGSLAAPISSWSFNRP